MAKSFLGKVKAKPKLMEKDPSRLFRGTQPSLWKFWEHGVTSSFLNSYRSCREQTRLAYIEGLRSRHVPLYFEFGNCVHWILEQAYQDIARFAKGHPGPDMVEAWIEAYKRKWLDETPKPTSRQLEQQELVYGQAAAVLPSYFKRWSGDFTGKYAPKNPTTAPARWDSLEEVFAVPYVFPDGKHTMLRGRRDGVFADKRGKIWVFDTKCRSVINHDDACETLPMDLQQMLYLYITYEERKHALREPDFPVGTVMNILRRPGLRQRKDESLADFCARTAEDVADPKRTDWYFIRYEMTITPKEILDWKRNQLDPLLAEVRGWWEGTIPHYMNDANLVSKHGRCQLFDVVVNGDTSNCYRREDVFPELIGAV